MYLTKLSFSNRHSASVSVPLFTRTVPCNLPWLNSPSNLIAPSLINTPYPSYSPFLYSPS